MMPLWTTATSRDAIGCALRSEGTPCVAQRVWPMPILPCTGWRSIRVAIFQAPQAVDEQRRHFLPSDNADNAAHYFASKKLCVMPGLIPGIHVFAPYARMGGTSPGMTSPWNPPRKCGDGNARRSVFL